MGYMEGILRRALKRLEEHLKEKDKYYKRVKNRQKLYEKKLKLNRKL
ncbi:hypothetical protein IRP63_16310 [Clostridium phage CWou-2020a]|nr:hypothetical protein [Clostridium botulinum]QPW59430.1 hypothetical protein IRP63_16310 [Clostridium phage CWou-2020a]MCD3240904.1 hypothetical protein [Clostridium botulinum D/C]MCD3299801.1 hypothetical protein [Clostridium botulinum D/C]MCD3306455.1 hypothetical protein [Clostridium botulinum D/C]MCD3315934.1 hypothetical protein [Clostridium botulinum D/C]